MSLIKGLGISILLQSSFTNIIATNSDCSTSFESTNDECLQEYQSEMNTAQQNGAHPDTSSEIEFRNYLKDLPKPTYLWYTHWNDLQANDNLEIDYCVAIEVIDSVSANQCLCQLKASCDDICDNQIEDLFITETKGLFLDPFPTGLVTKQQCQNVLQQIENKQYDILCSETKAYTEIVTCAGGINTLSPNATPNPTLPPIQTPSPTTPAPTTPAPSNTQSDTTNTPQTTKSTTQSTFATTDTPKPTILGGAGDSNASTTTTQQSSTPSTTYDYNQSYNDSNMDTTNWLQNAERGNDTDTPTNTPYQPWTSSSTIRPTFDVTENYSTTASTSGQLANDITTPNNESHPFANLLLVSLIILGFCVFVAWYAKKNQIATDGSQGNEEDNGYLWGLTQSSPSNDQRMEVKNGNNKRGKSRHKKLISQFDDDELDQEMSIQMGKMSNNNDLLAITPDHVGRLQTRGVAPNQLAPKIPHNKRSKRNRKRDTKRTKRGGKHGKFEQVKDDEDPCPDDSDSEDDSESGEDMMKMRDEYYASQTFGKKLVDTLGDIHDTVKVTAQAVKTKLTKKEPTVVRPMQMGAGGGGKKTKSRKKDKRLPFTMVNEEETTDGFDLSGDDDDSASTQEDEYREDSETEVRMNIHGRRIKQPMKLPTFDDDDDEEIDLTATQNIDQKSKKKKKKKDKKRKKKKEKKERESKQQLQQQQEIQQVEQEEVVEEIVNEKVEIKAEVHDINITINNDDKMGFGTDELEEDDNIDLTKTNIDDLSKDDEAMTLKDLEKELMNAGKNNNDNTDNHNNNNNPDTTNVVDLSFMDVVDNNSKNDNIKINVESNVINNDNENNNDELLNGNGVVGNGNVPHQD